MEFEYIEVAREREREQQKTDVLLKTNKDA